MDPTGSGSGSFEFDWIGFTIWKESDLKIFILEQPSQRSYNTNVSRWFPVLVNFNVCRRICCKFRRAGSG